MEKGGPQGGGEAGTSLPRAHRAHASHRKPTCIARPRGLRPRTRWRAIAAGWLALAALAPLARAGTTEGLAWLQAAQGADGGFATTATALATPVQSTAEVLRAYQALGESSSPSFAPALAYLNNDPEANTEFLARKILINAAAGADVTALLDALLAHRNADGGFGDQPGYASAVLDTAYALEALGLTQPPTSTAVQGAVAYLLTRQQPDGGFADGANASSAHLTALAMRALAAYRATFTGVAGALSSAQDFLFAQRRVGGLWAETFDTALALIALIPHLPDTTAVAESIDALKALQFANGSWAEDPYTTALALRALALAAAPPPNPALGAIRGTVIDGLTGLALPGVAVTLGGAAATSAQTDSAGRFKFGNLAPGAYTLRLSLAGYAPLSTATAVNGGQTVDLGALALLKSTTATTATVRGVVRDAATGAPLSAVVVTATGAPVPAVSDAAGAYQITNVPPGAIGLRAAKTGYFDASASATVDAGELLVFSPALVAKSGVATLRGRAVDAATSAPLAGVTVNLSGPLSRTAVTAPDGVFAFTDLPPGTYGLQLTLSGYVGLSASAVADTGELDLGDLPLSPASAPTGGTLRGTVTDAQTGQPIAGAAIAVTGLDTVLTDANGSYRIDDVPPGSLLIEASSTDYLSVAATAELAAGGVLVFSPALTPVSAQTAILQGTVSDGVTGLPLAGVAINVSGASTASATTDALGGYRIEDLNPGTIAVSAAMAGYDTVTAAGTVTANSITTFSPRLYPVDTPSSGANATGVKGVVLDAATHLPLAGVAIDAAFGTLQDSLVTGADGRFEITGLESATSGSLQFALAGYDSVTLAVTLEPLTVLDLGEVRLRPAQASALLPDLIAESLDTQQVVSEPATLRVTGTLGVTVANRGTAAVQGTTGLLAFYDANQNGAYDPGTDTDLGQGGLGALAVGASQTVQIALAGQLPFRDAPVSVWVDSVQSVVESNEANNISTTAALCTATGSAETVITFEDFTPQECPAQTPFAPDRYRSRGVVLTSQDGGNPVCWNASGSPSVLDDPNGGAESVPFGVIGNLSATTGVQARFVDPVTGAQATTDMVRVVALSGPGADLLSPNVALIAYDIAGNEIARADADASKQFDILQVRSPGIARVLMTAGANKDAFDNFTFTKFSENAVDGFNPVLKWAWNSSPILPLYNQVMMSPAVAPTVDTNGDGKIDQNDVPSVIFVAFGGGRYDYGDGILRIVSGADGTDLVAVTDPAYRIPSYANLAVGDIDGDGAVDIVAPWMGGGLIAFNHDGTYKWSTVIPRQSNWTFGGPSLADLDGDGKVQIVYGKTVLNADGTIRWIGTGPYIGANHLYRLDRMSVVADLDLDGYPEIIAGASAYDRNGKLLWQNSSVGDGLVAIGNFTGDQYPQIAIVASRRVFLLDHLGNIIWGPVAIPAGGQGGAPTIADFEGNGTAGIGVAGAGRYTVFRADGSILWSMQTQDYSSNITGSSAFDFTGDGRAKVLYQDERYLRAYDGKTGAVLFQITNSDGTASEYPVIADVDGTGHAAIISVSNRYYGNTAGSTVGLRVFQDANNSWVATRRIWNQHSYHITNINDDGSVPAVEQNSWQVHNTYRLNAFPDRDPLAVADLSAALLRFHPGGPGAAPSLSVRIGNAGAAPSGAATVGFYEGDPNAGGRLLGEVALPSLAAGAFTDISLANVTGLSGSIDLFAVADAGNRVIECREDNNVVSIPGPALFPDLVVASVDISQMTQDPLTLEVNGTVTASTANLGTLASPAGAQVLAFYDANGNKAFDPDTDTALGEGVIGSAIAPASTFDLAVSVRGKLPFRDAPITVFADSTRKIEESNENNNTGSTQSACRIELPPLGQIAMTLKWHWNGTAANPNRNNVLGPVAVGQLTDDNGDGSIDERDIPDLVFVAGAASTVSSPNVIVAVSGDDGREIWSRNDLQVTHRGSIALGDIDGDGIVELVISGRSRANLYALEHDGTLKWSAPSGPVYGYAWVADGVAIADLNHDGSPEIIQGRRVYDASGRLLWQGAGDAGGPDDGYFKNWGFVSIAANVDRAGTSEVVAGRTLYDAQGNIIWHRGDLPHDGFNAVGNFDEDEFAEIVLVSGGQVYLLEHTGETVWGPVAIPGGGRGGPPTIADFDGDGQPEIGVAGARAYTVFETDGSVKWSSPTQDLSSNMTGSSVFDFDGDGRAEVLYADERNFRIYDGVTGEVLSELHNTSVTTLEYPNVVDVDNDGQAEIILTSNRYGVNPTSGVRVFEAENNGWAPTRNLWNQHSYHITNINDDGTVPAHEQPSWLTHNTYRLNAFPDRSPLAAPDLSASLLKILDHGADEPPTLSVRIGNAGAAASPATTVAFYQGDPAAGGTLIGAAAVPALAPGAYTDVTFTGSAAIATAGDVVAIVDPNDALAECREDNNRVSTPVPGSTRVGIAVATDKPIYGPDSPVLLQALVSNNGILTGHFTAELRVEDAAGVLVQAFPVHAVSGLTGGGATTLTDGWNTANTLAGTYRLHGLVRALTGEVLAEAVSPFEIRHSATATPVVALRTTTDRPVYHTTDFVAIEDLVRNVTTNTLITDAVLTVRVLGPAGQVVFTDSVALGSLMPGGVIDVPSLYGLIAAPEGSYRVQATVRDGAQQLLATDEALFTVATDLAKALKGTVTVARPTLEVGQTQSCTDTVTNTATTTATGLVLHHALVNIDTEALIGESVEEITLAPAAEHVTTRTLATAGLPAGHYACLIRARTGEGLATLAFAPFVLTEPPIRLDLSLDPAGPGRVLVLLDAKSSCDKDGHDDDRGGKEGNDNGADAHKDAKSTKSSGSAGGCEGGPDPHGTGDAPDLAAQRAFLEKLLTDAGWSYTLTTTAQDFTSELRSGRYNTYALLAEHEKLSEQAQKELREAVFRGEGLLVAGAHDRRHNTLPETLGVKYIGTVADAVGTEYLGNPLGLTGRIALLPEDKPLRVKPLTATPLAVYTLGNPGRPQDPEDCRSPTRRHGSSGGEDQDDRKEDGEDECHGDPHRYLDAILTNDYGQGRAALAAFDLLATATRDGDASLAARSILALLEHVAPPPGTYYTGAVVPIQLTLTNQGIATPVTVLVTLPEGVTGLDAPQGELAGPSVAFNIDLLDVDETLTRTVWVKLPATPGAVEVTAAALVPAKPDPVSQAALTLPVEPALNPKAAADVLKGLLTPGYPDNKEIEQAINALDQAAAAKDTEKAVAFTLKATDHLLGLSDPAVTATRVKLGYWLKAVTAGLPAGHGH